MHGWLTPIQQSNIPNSSLVRIATMQHQTEHEAIHAALEAGRHAYAPYSEFLVGAAIRTTSGRIVAGCNVENASYGLTMCAERNAVAAMVAGGEREIALVVVASRGGVTPCGACRQVLAEFGLNFPVVLVDSETQAVQNRWLMKELLPGAFKLTL
jgi:cytidine deaminase